VKSHIYERNSPSFWNDEEFLPEIILEDIRNPNFTDIHILRGE